MPHSPVWCEGDAEWKEAKDFVSRMDFKDPVGQTAQAAITTAQVFFALILIGIPVAAFIFFYCCRDVNVLNSFKYAFFTVMAMLAIGKWLNPTAEKTQPASNKKKQSPVQEQHTPHNPQQPDFSNSCYIDINMQSASTLPTSRQAEHPQPQKGEIAAKIKTSGDNASRYMKIRVTDATGSVRKYSLQNGVEYRYSVGREEDCFIVIHDGSVSGCHAYIVYRQGRWHVVDNHSTNGLFMNGRQVYDAVLHNGDVVQLGSSSIACEMAGEATACPINHAGSGAVPSHYSRSAGASRSTVHDYSGLPTWRDGEEEGPST